MKKSSGSSITEIVLALFLLFFVVVELCPPLYTWLGHQVDKMPLMEENKPPFDRPY